MSFIDIAKGRYSCRKYQDKKVEKEKLDKILMAAHVVPTAANCQPLKLLVIQEKEGFEKVSKSAILTVLPWSLRHMKCYKSDGYRYTGICP